MGEKIRRKNIFLTDKIALFGFRVGGLFYPIRYVIGRQEFFDPRTVAKRISKPIFFHTNIFAFYTPILYTYFLHQFYLHHFFCTNIFAFFTPIFCYTNIFTFLH